MSLASGLLLPDLLCSAGIVFWLFELPLCLQFPWSVPILRICQFSHVNNGLPNPTNVLSHSWARIDIGAPEMLGTDLNISAFFLNILFIFRERGREGEREGERHQWLFHISPTGDPACNPGMCPAWAVNQQLLGSQAGTQSAEPQQPRDISWLLFLPWMWFNKGLQRERCR